MDNDYNHFCSWSGRWMTSEEFALEIGADDLIREMEEMQLAEQQVDIQTKTSPVEIPQ